MTVSLFFIFRANYNNSSPSSHGSSASILLSPLTSDKPHSGSPGTVEHRPIVSGLSKDRGNLTPRFCSAICEEMIEEGDEDEIDVVQKKLNKPIRSSSSRPSRNKTMFYDLSSNCIAEEYASDDSDSRSSDNSNKSPIKSPIKSPSHTSAGVRPLHTVRSSPQLLKQIHEEQDNLISKRSNSALLYKSPRHHIMSPDGLRKYERRHKRLTHGSRGTSCSSSDASDTDETDTKKRKDKLKGRFHRRDSGDQSSDTDGGPAPPPSGGRRYSGGNGDTGTSDGRDDNNENKKEHDDDKKQTNNNGKQANGIVCALNEKLSIKENSLSERMATTISLTASNISMRSSTTSLSSRSGKYVVPNSNSKYNDNLVEMMNKENQSKGRVIHVRSKDFSDLMTRFSHSKQQQKESHIGKCPRRRGKIRTDINKNVQPESVVGRCMVDPVSNVQTKCCSLV